MPNRLPRLFGARVASTNARSDLRVTLGEVIALTVDPLPARVNRPRRLTHIGVQRGPTRIGIFKLSMNGVLAGTLSAHCTPMVGLRQRRFTAGPQSGLGFWERGAQNRGKERHLVDARGQLSDELFQAVVQ